MIIIDLRSEIENKINNKINGESHFINKQELFQFFETKDDFYQNLSQKQVSEIRFSYKTLTKSNVLRGTRNRPNETQIKRVPGKVDGDQVCHIIARCLGGRNSPEDNLFSGTKLLNESVMNPLEVYIRGLIDKSTDSNIQVFYSVYLTLQEKKKRYSDIYIALKIVSEDSPKQNMIQLKINNDYFFRHSSHEKQNTMEVYRKR